MINTLESYIRNSLPEDGSFFTNPNLSKKVDSSGKILPYMGNTVVFLLEEPVKQRLQELRDRLYLAAPEMLAEKLNAETFHMTLHDLVNGTGAEKDLPARMESAESAAKRMIFHWKQDPPLRMRATCCFNMVNTSIVLGLSPAEEESWRRLDEMYCALESVVPLSYALTPHITLAYYRPGKYSQETVNRLRSVLGEAELELEIRMEDLVLQNFLDMNHYETVS